MAFGDTDSWYPGQEDLPRLTSSEWICCPSLRKCVSPVSLCPDAAGPAQRMAIHPSEAACKAAGPPCGPPRPTEPTQPTQPTPPATTPELPRFRPPPRQPTSGPQSTGGRWSCRMPNPSSEWSMNRGRECRQMAGGQYMSKSQCEREADCSQGWTCLAIGTTNTCVNMGGSFETKDRCDYYCNRPSPTAPSSGGV